MSYRENTSRSTADFVLVERKEVWACTGVLPAGVEPRVVAPFTDTTKEPQSLVFACNETLDILAQSRAGGVPQEP